MDYEHLTADIYDDEHEYTPIAPLLSFTDSNPSLPPIWRNVHAQVSNYKQVRFVEN